MFIRTDYEPATAVWFHFMPKNPGSYLVYDALPWSDEKKFYRLYLHYTFDALGPTGIKRTIGRFEEESSGRKFYADILTPIPHPNEQEAS